MKDSEMTIMVVDDDPGLRDIFTVLLEEEGIVVVAAENGKEAWKQLTSGKHKINAIISDVIMPEMDGKQLLKKIATLPVQERPLIYMMSGHSELTRDEAIAMGAQDMIPKPFDIEKLIGDIRSKLS